MLRWSFSIQKRMDKQIKNKKKELVKELKKGEKPEFIKNFNRDSFLNDLQKKYVTNK